MKPDFRDSGQSVGEQTLLLNEIQRLAHLGFWEWDVSENKVTWSNELYDIYGIDPGHFSASFEGYVEKLHPDDRERVKNLIQSALTDKKEVNFYERIVRPDGNIRYLRSWGSVEVDENERVVKMFGVCLDVTESKLQEISLQAREEELELRIQERTKELKDQNKVIHAQKVAIEKLYKETHHRLKNNLQIISSLLRLQSNMTDDAEVISMFEECHNRIQTMALIHDKMFRSKRSRTLSSRAYLTELVEDIIASSQLDNKIELRLDIQDFKIDSKKMVPLGMIINEIIVNSVKHAFDGYKSGYVFFEFKRSGKRGIHMVIGDNGSGDREGGYLREGSLGTELIQTFVEQLNGTFTRREDAGTIYEFDFEV